MSAIAALTIGHAPRPDVGPVLRRVLGPLIDIVERGALDGLTREDIARLQPGVPAHPLITRLADGSPVVVDRELVAQRLQARLDELPPGVALVALLCTGTFGHLRSRVPIVYPERVLAGLVSAVAPVRLGVIVPLDEQRERLLARWQQVARHVWLEVAPPYGDQAEVAAAARRLAARGTDLVILDCIGYTDGARAVVRAETGGPVIQASAALAHVVAALVGT